ncbi:MAG: HDOD domain-containing protein [Nitrospinaceae bacterium]
MKFKIENVPDRILGSPLHIYCELQKAVNDPDQDFNDLDKIIRIDVSLTARLLKVVNSAYYGLESKIETITEALGVIGTDQLMDLVLATSIIGKFQGIPTDLFNMNLFWKHSIACGLGSRAIARIKKEPSPERYYVAGLVHDLGRVILCLTSPQIAESIFEEHARFGEPMQVYEEKYLETKHGEIAGHLFRNWQLPDYLTEVVDHHHEPSKCTQFLLPAAIVHYADFLSYDMRLGSSGEMYAPILDPAAERLLNLSSDHFAEIEEEMSGQLEEILRVFL